ncbi:MAG: S1 RNA-binding domain-containing protein [Candidatus Sungbacteria bacterium]|nr:S1 RNA-binding domain-containing protein [bacterium]MDZ4260119.1 S1 RNA-binding domain-containing protein [Candidatus Sungbacteria bacterium]
MITNNNEENIETGVEQDAQGRASAIAAGLPKKPHPMEALLKTFSSHVFLKSNDIVEGTVLEKRGGRLFIDLGVSGAGIVYGKEYFAAQDIIKNLNIGDRVSAKVVEVDNHEGYIELSLQEAGKEKRWVDLRKMMQEGTLVDVPVKKANTGGLILEFQSIEGFLPASQLSFKHYPRVEGGDKEKIFQELQKMVGSPLRVKILDLNPDENKLIFTEKGLDAEEMRKVLTGYSVGDIVEGEITGVVDFGAFMKFNEIGLEGLIHLSEIDWTLVSNPREILKPGDKVKAKIIDIQGDKISLSLKQLKNDPWINVTEKYHKDDVVNGTVTKFNPFGAFVELDPDIQGLAHISEFGTEQKMRDVLKLNTSYQFNILLVDPKEHRISLGLAGMPKKEKIKKESAEVKTAETE